MGRDVSWIVVDVRHGVLYEHPELKACREYQRKHGGQIHVKWSKP